MIKPFVVAYLSFFDNVLHQEVILSDTAFNAMKFRLQKEEFEVWEDIKTEEALKQFAFDCDSAVSAIEI